MTPVQEMYDYIVHTLNAAQIVELCAMLLHVEADTLRAWVARCEGGQNK